MELKPRLRKQLIRARELSETLLKAFDTPEAWTRQIFPGANHALWFVGHMGQVDNLIVGMISPDKKQDPPRYGELFGMNSRPVGNPAEYPPPEEVLGRMRERRERLLEVFDALSEDDLPKPLPPGGPAFLTDHASAFELAIFHEGLHAGQVTMMRRSLGHPPIMGAPRKPS